MLILTSFFCLIMCAAAQTVSWLMRVSLQSGDSVRLNPWEAAALEALSVGTHLWQPHVCCFCLRLWRPWPRRDSSRNARYTPGDTCNHKETLCSTAPQWSGFTETQLLTEYTETYCIRLMLSEGKLWRVILLPCVLRILKHIHNNMKAKKSYSIKHNEFKSLYWADNVK